MSVVDLINNQIDRTNEVFDIGIDAINNIAADRGATGLSQYNIGSVQIDGTFLPPPEDQTPLPVYEEPAIAIPETPGLAEIRIVNTQDFPDAPTVTTAGLFSRVAPDSEMPIFDEPDPELHIDYFVAELAKIAKPVIEKIAVPGMTPVTIGSAPTLSLPEYDPAEPPSQMQAPEDYAKRWEDEYEQRQGAIKGFVDTQVNEWLGLYAPGYDSLQAQFHAQLMDSDTALPEEFETKLMSRHEAAIRNDFSRAKLEAVNDSSKMGWFVPPGATTGRVGNLRQAAALTVSGQATAVAIEVMRTQVQWRQSVLQLSSSVLDGLRGQALQFFSNSLSIVSSAQSVASEVVNRVMATYSDEIRRRELGIAIMDALGRELDVRLKVALSGLDGYKMELSALSLRSDVEMKQIEGVRLQVQQQQLEVDLYRSLIGAVKDSSFVDELALKEYTVKGDIFKIKSDSMVSSFDAYRAYIEGDKGKLSGELAKLELYDKELNAIKTKAAIESTQMEGDIKGNEALMSQYNGLLSAYDVVLRAAVDKFKAQATLKGLGLQSYNTGLDTAKVRYEGDIRKGIAQLDGRLKGFSLNSENLQEFFRLDQKYADMNMTAQTSVAQIAGNMAAAMANATNANISQTE